MNRSTQMFHTILKRSAARAARVVEQELRSDLPWVRLAAARTILERAAPLLAAEEERGDVTWLKRATFEELTTIRNIMMACLARRGDAFGAEALPEPTGQPAALPGPEPQPLEAVPDELVIEPTEPQRADELVEVPE